MLGRSTAVNQPTTVSGNNMSPLRIATWNIGGGFISANNGNSFDEENLPYFASELKKLNCDIVCLQEVHLSISPNQPDQAAILSSLLNYPFQEICACDFERPSHLKSDQLLAIAIISRFRMIRSQYLTLSNPDLTVISKKETEWITHDKGFLKTTLEANRSEFDVITGHNVPFRAFKRDFMEPEFSHIRQEIEAFVLASAQKGPTIFIGDINYEDVERLLPRLFAAGFSKALSNGGTEPISGAHIDHIIISRE
ncbi:MAG: endonuclease/exonuclease/phosphatase family protein [Chloroflexi bacterium]|nr:endonuclease/exonuclease/phosphatase family protein [Chloroflexota bacterium]